jgi:hypothetical protein
MMEREQEQKSGLELLVEDLRREVADLRGSIEEQRRGHNKLCEYLDRVVRTHGLAPVGPDGKREREARAPR